MTEHAIPTPSGAATPPSRRRFLAAATGGAAAAAALPLVAAPGSSLAATEAVAASPVTFPEHPGAVYARSSREPLNASVDCGRQGAV